MKPEIFHEQPPADHPEVAFFEPEVNEDISYCNCENAEQLTPYEAETVTDAILENASAKNDQKPRSESVFAQNTAFSERQDIKKQYQHIQKCLAAQKRKKAFNPYLKRTRTCEVALYRNPQDDTPIDSMKTQSVRGGTLRSMLTALGLGMLILLGGFYALKASVKEENETKKD